MFLGKGYNDDRRYKFKISTNVKADIGAKQFIADQTFCLEPLFKQ
jgi:hypothetical protein